jgi:DNA replication and repair protein RecF
MKITHLEVKNFRNLINVQLDLNHNINIFYGDNGSGKTSLLESIYFLGLGRSFRTQLLRYIITHNHDNIIIFARIQNQYEPAIPIGIEKTLNGNSAIRIAAQNINTHAELTKLLPMQLINAQTYTWLESGPKFRRQFIDWGVFHVEHSFLLHWQKMQRALRQRNAILKQNLNTKQLEPWDQEFIESSNILHNLRQEYITKLTPVFSEIITKLLNTNLKTQYYPGWDTEKSLQKQLQQTLSRDIQLGYTSIGPQKADLRFQINNIPAQNVLSRGQRKLLICALQLAQGRLLYQYTGKNCIYLIDDLPAELDNKHRQQIINILSKINAQIFVTGVRRDDLIIDKNMQMFHVKHGEIVPDR